MPFPTTGPNTQLQAVNQILASVGQAPVNTLTTEETFVLKSTGTFVVSITGVIVTSETSDLQIGTYITGPGVEPNTAVSTTGTAQGTNPDVGIAYNTLTEVTREVQAEGWSYNVERNYDKLQPNTSDKKIHIPNNVIQADLSQDYVSNLGRNVVNRGGVLYDTIKHTDIWDTDETLYFDILWEFEYDNIPQPIQDYIVARAASVASSRLVGEPNKYQILQQKEAYTRAMALEYDCNQGDHSFFGAPQSGNYYKSYSPFNTLIR